MRMIASLIEEQGVRFALFLVKKHVIDSTVESERAVTSFAPLFPGIPIVLAAKNSRGRFTYYGRDDIIKYLASVDPKRIPWREFGVR